MRLLSIGDQVEAGIYRFHSRFNRAVNFVHGRRLVSVVDEEIGEGPLSIVLQDLPGATVRPATGPLEVRARSVVFQERELPFTRAQRYRSTLPRARGSVPRFRRNLACFGELLRTRAPPDSLAFLLDDAPARASTSGFHRALAARMRRSVAALLRGDRRAGLRGLRGCGAGLTPSGDDFLAGHLIALHLLQLRRARRTRPAPSSVLPVARSDNPFTATFLDLAARGLLFGRMKNLIQALRRGDEATVADASAKLFAIGGTSGADLGTGFFMTLNQAGAP